MPTHNLHVYEHIRVYTYRYRYSCVHLSNKKKKVQQYFGFEMFLFVGFDRGVSPYDRTNTVYVEEKRGWSGSAVLRSQNYFVGDQHETLIQHVEDFEIQDEYMFVTKKPVGFPCRGSNPVGTHPSWVNSLHTHVLICGHRHRVACLQTST